MTIEETRDAALIGEIFRDPVVRAEMRLPPEWTHSILLKQDSKYLIFRRNDGALCGLVWLDVHPEGYCGHVAFNRLCRGKRAVKAIKAAVNYCFLHYDWPEIWTKAPFAKSHMLVKLLGWEDVRLDEEDWGPPWGRMKRRVAVLTREKWLATTAYPPFFVVGYPRSGTAWLANLLTTDGMYCLHEGTLLGPTLDAWLYGGPERGNSDSMQILNSNLIQRNPDAKVVWIQRERDSALASLTKHLQELGLDPTALTSLLDRLDVAHDTVLEGRDNVLKIQFTELFTLESAQRVWSFVHPKSKFDATRAKMLLGLNVQQDLKRALALSRAPHSAANPILPELDPDDLPCSLTDQPETLT